MKKERNAAPRQVLARNVRYLMQKHGDTQASLSKRAGITQSNVYYVIGTDRHVRLDTVEAIASAYGLNAWHLINPSLPQDLVDSPAISRLINTYINATPEGRALIDAVSDREARYAKDQ